LNTIPDPVVELLDLESISVSRESFVDPELKKSQFDVLITTRVRGRPAYIYVLVEHKSRPEYRTVLQLLGYMVRIWEKEVKIRTGKEVKKPLPVIIPVIFYQGSRTWRYPVAFGEYFETPADFEHYIPDFAPEFTDLARTPDHRIFGNVLFQSALRTMKYIVEGPGNRVNIVKLLNILHLLAKAHVDQRYYDFLSAFFRYILKADSKDDERPLRKAIESVDLTLGRETFMTIAEKLIEEGREEGVLLNKQEVLIRQLDKKFGLKEREKEAIRACGDKKKLDRGIDVILTAENKDEVLEELGGP
jgi:predicted transposase YdaD